MNKTKIILPVVSLFLLTGCGPKTENVKEIWGNTWAYVNSSAVSYNSIDAEKLKAENIDWDNTTISCPYGGYESVTFNSEDRKIENIIGSEFIRTSNYPIFKDNRDFFAKNRITVSSKADHKVKVGNVEYQDAKEATGDPKVVVFNNDYNFLKPASYDSEDYIDEVDAVVTADGKNYCNHFVYMVGLKNSTDRVDIKAYIELVALA